MGIILDPSSSSLSVAPLSSILSHLFHTCPLPLLLLACWYRAPCGKQRVRSGPQTAVDAAVVSKPLSSQTGVDAAVRCLKLLGSQTEVNAAVMRFKLLGSQTDVNAAVRLL
jgi:hypothetical protein